MLAGSGWQIAPDTYYATVKRPLPRAVPDPEILAEIRPTRTEYEADAHRVRGGVRRRKTLLELNRREIRGLCPGPQERLPQDARTGRRA